MTSVEVLNLSCLTMPDSNVFLFDVQRKEITRISEKLVASVTNGVRDTAVDICRFILPNYESEQRQMHLICRECKVLQISRYHSSLSTCSHACLHFKIGKKEIL